MTSGLRCLVTRQPIDPLTDRYHTLRDTDTHTLYYVLDAALLVNDTVLPPPPPSASRVRVCCGDGVERCIVRAVTGLVHSKRSILTGHA